MLRALKFRYKIIINKIGLSFAIPSQTYQKKKKKKLFEFSLS